MKFIGLRLDDHDSSITYTNGTKVNYYKPERENQIKHFGYSNLIDWALTSKKLNFKLNELDAVCIVLDSFAHPYLPKEKKDQLFDIIEIPYSPFTELKCPVFRIDHHYAHSLSSWMLTNAKDNFTLDGLGDSNRGISIFKNNINEKNYTIDEINPLGHFLYNFAKTFEIKGHPEDIFGKVMALQSFGKLDLNYWNIIKDYNYKDFNIVANFDNYFKAQGSLIASRLNLINYLKTIHHFVENKIPDFFSKFIENNTEFSYTGGVAHNICVNTSLKKKFPNMVIPPHCSDEGLTLGCVEFLRRYFEQPFFCKDNFPFWQSDQAPEDSPSDNIIDLVAEELAKGKIVGWYQGNGEIGPRALGNRSILMSPEVTNGKHILNEKIKHREDYRPFAASIKKEETKNYFDWNYDSEFMKYSVKFKDKVFAPISHIDQTSRIQTVNSEHVFFYKLLDKFQSKTGLPMLLNTSLNDNGKPIAGKPKDAIDLFTNSNLDILVIGNKMIKK